jgi:glutaredoxin 3
MSSVTIYTKTGCPYCAAARKHYAESGISFEEINVTERPAEQTKLLEITGGQRIVPVIVEGDDVKLGFGGG